MKLLVINKLLIDRGWQLIDKTGGSCLFSPADHLRMERLVVLPAQSNSMVPLGTLEAIMRRSSQQKATQPWHCALSDKSEFDVIIERSGDVMWGRLEMKGLLLVVRNKDTDSLLKQVREALTDLTAGLSDEHRQYIETMRINVRCDMAEVWSLLRQVRVSHIAGMAGIDATLVNQFMGGTAFPSADQAIQLERSIRELGRQLMQISSH